MNRPGESLRFDQLFFRGVPGMNVAEAAAIVMRHGLGGFVFNGVVVERESGDSMDGYHLVFRYNELMAMEEPK